jgi:hypothetical protein
MECVGDALRGVTLAVVTDVAIAAALDCACLCACCFTPTSVAIAYHTTLRIVSKTLSEISEGRERLHLIDVGSLV